MKFTTLAALACALCLSTTEARANTIVEFKTSFGNVDVSLFDNDAPVTVANFLSYVNSGAYSNTFIHRSVHNFVIQGGGYNTQAQPIPNNPPIPLEYNLPNTIGTLSMARTVNINSATSQWFFNLIDNSQNLGPTNGGGYAVFGQVLGNGMDVINAIAALSTFAYNSPFGEVPLINFTQTDFNNHVDPLPHIVVINSVAVVPEPSTVVLAVLGFAGLAICAWRRRNHDFNA